MNNNSPATVDDIKELSTLISQSVTRLTGLKEKEIIILKESSQSKLLNDIGFLAMEIASFAEKIQSDQTFDGESLLAPSISRSENSECPCCKIS